MRMGQTEATEVLDRLLKVGETQGPGQLRNVLSVAREYADHPSIRGKAMPAGQRLLVQLKFALDELDTRVREESAWEAGAMEYRAGFGSADEFGRGLGEIDAGGS